MTNDQMKSERYLRFQRARRKLAWISARLEEGRYVYVSTALRSTEFRPKHKADIDVFFKATRSGLYMARGKKWDCIDFCKITAG